MTNRLRIVGYQITPVLHIDDGDTLSPPLQVQPVFVAATDWPGVHQLMADAVEVARTQIEQVEPAPAPPPNRATRRAKHPAPSPETRNT